MQWPSWNVYWEQLTQASSYAYLPDYMSFAKEFLNTLSVHRVATVKVPGRRTDDHAINVEVLNQSATSELYGKYMKLVKVQTSKGEVDPVHAGETASDNH